MSHCSEILRLLSYANPETGLTEGELSCALRVASTAFKKALKKLVEDHMIVRRRTPALEVYYKLSKGALLESKKTM